MSVRLDADDAAFLADLQIDGARTPSDKLRAVIAEARQRRLLERDYETALAIAGNLFGRVLREVRASEQAFDVHPHSEVVVRTIAWLEETAAVSLSSHLAPEEARVEDLQVFEEALVERACSLLQSFLQLAVAPEGMCYRSEVFEARLAPILKLASLIEQQRERNHG
jgi:hypothetical protein